MSKPINLNRFRKEKTRRAAKEQADRNAVLHGLTKAEKDRLRAEERRLADRHEGNRMDAPEEDE